MRERIQGVGEGEDTRGGVRERIQGMGEGEDTRGG